MTQTQPSPVQSDTTSKEPVLIVDVTGSMNDPAAPTPGAPTRREVATQVARILVTTLAGEDTQGKDEQGGGGLLTLWFSNGVAGEVGGEGEGDLSPANFTSKWNTILWHGGTYITPAFQLMLQKYHAEFDEMPVSVRPVLMAAILTDGALNDLNATTRFLATLPDYVYVYAIVIGYGDEHAAAVSSWSAIARTNAHVQVKALASATDANEIASHILAMVQ